MTAGTCMSPGIHSRDCRCVVDGVPVGRQTTPCLPSLGEACGSCHRCTDPALTGRETTCVYRPIGWGLGWFLCAECGRTEQSHPSPPARKAP